MPQRMAIPTGAEVFGPGCRVSVAKKKGGGQVARNRAAMASRTSRVYGMVAVSWFDAMLSMAATSTLFT